MKCDVQTFRDAYNLLAYRETLSEQLEQLNILEHQRQCEMFEKRLNNNVLFMKQ